MTGTLDVRPFALTGPLPTGVTVLEASAGTGKTYTIAGLAARYVAEGTPLRDLLLVTFTRMATGELRERVRERLVSAEQGLERALRGVPAGDRDEVVELLAEGPLELVAERRERLARAIADFDAATIATTHGFCQEVLGGLGTAGDLDPGAVFVEEVDDLVREVVDDLYVRRFQADERPPLFDRAEAGLIARMVVDNPGAALAAPGPAEAAQMRVRLAEAVRRGVEERKRRAGVITYDDLLTRLEAALEGPSGAAVAARLRQRFRVVLVDEFQDTDPIQWAIMRRAFADGGGTLVLIGDPKQAIYAFRGADVYAYLDAARTAGARATLEVNWRSDQGLIDAYDALFGGASLGHPGIVYRRVRAAGANVAPRLLGAPEPSPLRVRVVHRDDPSIGTRPDGGALLDRARAHVAQDVAADLVRLLHSGAEIELRDADGRPCGRERVRPAHVAVLVRTNHNAAAMRDALEEAGIPAVINGAGSVFGTPSALDWLRLLEALERPAQATRARAAALTPFLGWSAERVAAAGEEEWEDVHRRLHGWARVLRLRGVAALTETVTLAEGVPGRVLAAADGERRLTDLRHVAQLLHGAASAEQLGVTALTSWLRRRIAEAAEDRADEERSRRLESDEEAVQVLTIHRSKGLEFPIAYYPDLWEGGRFLRRGEPVVFHDPAAGDLRTVDVALQGPDYTRHREQHVVEQRGEDLRLAYVALTRARHQAVVWWAGSSSGRNSPLTRLLFARADDGTVAHHLAATPSDDEATARLRELAAAAPGCVAVERSRLGLPAFWSGPPREPAELAAARFDRALDRAWRRTSFSDLTAGAHEARVTSEPEEGALADEPPEGGAPPAGAGDGAVDAALRDVPAPLGAMPSGLQVGTLVHRVFEATDFTAPDLDAELAAQLTAARAWRAVDLGDEAAAIAGLRAAIETPLGPLLDGARLRDIPRADRLDELAFELPLAGGEDPAGRLEPAVLAALLREHLPPDDPLAGYADRLADPALRPSARGYLTGSLDLVVRRPDATGTPRFAVLDYKTNRLAAPGEELTAWHHRPAALAAEMRRGHYGLQALLYTAALHRYLRWRVPGYDPDRHLAGVLYLFVRGMTGPDTPVVGGTPCGVFAWRPPAALVHALSDLLDRGAPA